MRYGLLYRLSSTKGLGTKPEIMAEELSSVRAEHKFDETALDEYLKKNLQGFPRGPGTFNVLQYRFVFDLIASMISKTSDLCTKLGSFVVTLPWCFTVYND